MKNLRTPGSTEGIALATGVFALDLPPPSFGLVPSWWSGSAGAVPEIELEIWANAAVNLTNAELYGAALHALVFADITLTPDHTADSLGAVAHGLLTGDGPVQMTSTLTIPAGLSASTLYWVIKVDADSFKLALSLTEALTGTAVAFSGNGTGVIKLVDGDDTERVHWHSHGLLGPASDGAIALTAQRAYLTTRPHSARAIAYALVATLSTSDPESVSAAIWPRQDN